MRRQKPIQFEGKPGLYFYDMGEFRAPRQGEYYLSGAVESAWRAPSGLLAEYYIVTPTYRARLSPPILTGNGLHTRKYVRGERVTL